MTSQLAVYRRFPRPVAAGAVLVPGTHGVPAGPEVTMFDRAGWFDYTIPWWCTALDVVTLSGGAGGDGGGTRSSNPGTTGGVGAQGKWDARTLIRGRDLSWLTREVRVMVGMGGVGGVPGGMGTDGAHSFGGYEMQDVLADGGVGDHAHRLDSDIHPPQVVTFHNALLGLPLDLYSAGGVQNLTGAPGIYPGGGGGGGLPDQRGGNGHDGKVWIVAYRASVSDASLYHGLSHPVALATSAGPSARYRNRVALKCVVRTGLPLILDHGILSQTPVGVLDGGSTPGSVAPVVVSGGHP